VQARISCAAWRRATLPPGRALPRAGAGARHEAVAGSFRAQCLSRALDRTSRAMQKAGQGYYTIGSSGHEGMAAVAHALRPTDMAFLHYRDAAFQIARAGQVPGQTIAWDMLLSFACRPRTRSRAGGTRCWARRR
jgi:2-oxoisovalerate dehydrogenase E1 component